ncbi:ATP-binding protein [Streptomyces sp. CBG9]|uniref:ATP-binding protein n=1 Tax=Streptomyces sp. CBG9 TaxID=2762622 RepID=UPI00164493D4|nr:ATP-binding protein [Streptomyces sp. CBG9]
MKLRKTSDPTASSAPEGAGERHPLRLAHVVGHLTVTRAGDVTAWHTAAPAAWSFRPHRDRERLVAEHAARWADLRGRTVHLRVTHRPHAVGRWAAALHTAAHDPLPGWEDYLLAEQRRVGRLPLDDKVVMYGVSVGRVGALAQAAGRLRAGSVERALARMRETVAEIGRVMAGPGMDAAPATAADLDWLLTRSIGLGLPAPLSVRPSDAAVWHADDLAAWTDHTRWTAEPYASHLTVTGLRQEEPVTRLVTVLTMGRTALPDIPGTWGPWLQRLDQLPYPVEVSARVEVREHQDAADEIRKRLDAVAAQVAHHRQHRQPPPLSLARQYEAGQIVGDELSHGIGGTSTRARAWVRVAVAAPDPERLRDRITLLRDLYGSAVTWERPAAQWALAREYIPGEPAVPTGYTRRMPASTLGGSLPAVTATVGDRTGPHLGYTSGTARRPVMWHPWMAQEQRERSGLTPIVGTLGSGKSVLGGVITYHSVLMGVPAVVLDPSGPLSRMCDMPELRPYSRAIDLMQAEPGTLNPYRLIPDPSPEHYRPEAYAGETDPAAAAERAYRDDCAYAAGHRRTLTTDVLSSLLRPEIAGRAETHLALARAVREAPSGHRGSPRAVLDALRHQDGAHADHARDLAALLDDVAALPQGQLIFPAVDGDDSYQTRQWRLVVLSLRGLSLPDPGTDRADWGEAERLSVPLLYLAAWYAQRAIYARPMAERKLLWLDEAHEIQRVSSGRELLRKTGRDSRKHDLRALISTQDAQDIAAAGVANWVDAVWAGRTTGDEAARAALRLLGIAPEPGYVDLLAGLSPRQDAREFVFADGAGGMERVTVTVAPELRAALDSTPRRTADPWTKAARTTTASSSGVGA